MTAWKTEIDSPFHCIVLIVSDKTEATAEWVRLFRQGSFMVISEIPEHSAQAARIVAPWLVLVDVDVPHLARLELCRRLKAVSNGALPPSSLPGPMRSPRPTPPEWMNAWFGRPVIPSF